MFFISFSKILPLDENFFEVKLFQILQNQYKFSMILFRITENWRFDMILPFLKWFCFIENLIEWQNSQKAYKKQTLICICSGNKFVYARNINLLDNIFQQTIFQWITILFFYITISPICDIFIQNFIKHVQTQSQLSN